LVTGTDLSVIYTSRTLDWD